MRHYNLAADSRNVFQIYQEIDRKNQRVFGLTRLKCPDKCGSCCSSQNIQTTIVELYPLMLHILRSNRIDHLIDIMDHFSETAQCMLFQHNDDNRSDGFCSEYRYRPLVCRMFGFSSQRKKDGSCTPQTCRILRQTQPNEFDRLAELCLKGLVPDMATQFIRIASIDPQRGFRLMPINLALKEAIDFFFWRKPRYFNNRKSA